MGKAKYVNMKIAFLVDEDKLRADLKEALKVHEKEGPNYDVDTMAVEDLILDAMTWGWPDADCGLEIYDREVESINEIDDD